MRQNKKVKTLTNKEINAYVKFLDPLIIEFNILSMNIMMIPLKFMK